MTEKEGGMRWRIGLNRPLRDHERKLPEPEYIFRGLDLDSYWKVLDDDQTAGNELQRGNLICHVYNHAKHDCTDYAYLIAAAPYLKTACIAAHELFTALLNGVDVNTAPTMQILSEALSRTETIEDLETLQWRTERPLPKSERGYTPKNPESERYSFRWYSTWSVLDNNLRVGSERQRGNLICHVYDHAKKDCIDYACLIAAAPNLMVACTAAYELCTALRKGIDVDIAPTIQKLSDALARTEIQECNTLSAAG